MSARISFTRLLLPLMLIASCKSDDAGAQIKRKQEIKSKGYTEDSKAMAWADSIYNKLSETERIGQLFMVAAYSGGENFNQPLIEKLLREHQLGGIIFMQGTPEKQAELTNKYQKMAQVPLLIGMDAEWGLGMRLTGVKNYPRQMMIGATRNPKLMYAIGKASAEQCKRLGVHINFAPDVDVNNNPANPVINFRSFGEDKELVAEMGIAYMRGLQENGVMACAKHFPGHGDVSTDSHLDLPKINKSLAVLNEVELYPFRKLIDAGVQSVMIAHLDVPAIDNTPHLPTTLSHKAVTGLLRDKMKFKGLIFTDALNMKGVTKYFPDGETDLRAFLAGNDILLFSQDVPLAISKIQQAIKDGRATEIDLRARVTKILMAKYHAGLDHLKKIDTVNATNDINREAENIRERGAREAVTLVNDNSSLLQKISSDPTKIGYYAIGNNPDQLIGELKNNYKNIQELKNLTESAAGKYDVIVIAVHASPLYPGKDGNYGLSQQEILQLKNLVTLPNAITIAWGNAYATQFACDATALIAGYEEDDHTAKAVTDVLKGKLKPKGTLPVTPCN